MSCALSSQTLIDLFQEQVKRSPNLYAIISDSEKVTYQELYIRAQKLASQLNLHVNGPTSLIAIRGQRSLDFIIAILGTLITGAAYVPIDLLYPPHTLEYILKNVQPSLLINIGNQKQSSWEIINLDSSSFEKEKTARTPHKLAYVIYTSGITGDPKGIMIEHVSVCSRIKSLQLIYGMTEKDVILHNSPYGFDGSVEEIFLSLLTGSQLIVAPSGKTQKILRCSIDYINRYGVTTLYLMPTLWGQFANILVDEKKIEACASLKRLIGGGEVLRPHILKRLQSLLNIDYYYIYGPTENTINSFLWKCNWSKGMEIVPVGYPLPQTYGYLLDSTLFPVRPNEIGEIYLSGIGLAQAYINKEKLTAERFGTFGTQERLYKTRDLGRILPNGLLEYIGRKEYKDMPYEDYYNLARAQSFLSGQEPIEEAMLDVQDNGNIIAYLSFKEKAISPEMLKDLKSLFIEQLDAYKIKINEFIFVSNFPYTPAGKIDINELRLQN